MNYTVKTEVRTYASRWMAKQARKDLRSALKRCESFPVGDGRWRIEISTIVPEKDCRP